ncbi:MAG: LysR family transcriptional regulator [Actinobacteria bacterium]|nr:LysR family transcriptional regulator [Actinomycetota bacterium]
MLDLRRLMLLCDLADLGTVGAVAERRSITSSAVSQQLRVLEQETGAVLLRRDGRKLRLTQSGEILVEHVRRVMGAVDEALSAVAASRGTVDGRLTIATFETSIPSLAAPLVRRMSRDEPQLRVHVIQEDSATALRSLRRGEIDLALIFRLYFLADETVGGLISQLLFDDPLVLLAPAHLHRRIGERGLSALADEPWITGPHGSSWAAALDLASEAAGFVPRVTHRVRGAPNMCQLAAAEVAAAIVPRLSVPPALEELMVEGLDLGGRSVCVVHRDGAQNNPAVAAVLRTLRAIVADRDTTLTAGRLAERSRAAG